MSESAPLKLSKIPFLMADVFLLALAATIVFRNPAPLTIWENLLCAIAVGVGGWLSVFPYLTEYQNASTLLEAQNFSSILERVKNLEQIAAQINAATSQWQVVQEEAAQTVKAAKTVADKMTEEAGAFAEFMQKANDAEKNHLRLEVEKSRRAEGEWLQILVRLLDQVFALHQAAIQSGQKDVIQRVGHFQNACRDIARRVGLIPFTANANEKFDAQKYQLLEETGHASADSIIEKTIAPGYTFQGQLLRHALVTILGAVKNSTS
ncbi:MAG: nucleotide exchange factor GrpE [Limisphaerales bacterium]